MGIRRLYESGSALVSWDLEMLLLKGVVTSAGGKRFPFNPRTLAKWGQPQVGGVSSFELPLFGGEGTPQGKPKNKISLRNQPLETQECSPRQVRARG